VVLDRVTLSHPRHERLIGSYAVPGDSGIVGGWPWPIKPSHFLQLPPVWKQRRPVHGFQLGPGRTFNMILGIMATAAGQATSRGMTIYYHDPAGSYVASSGYAMDIAVGKASCE
jgi:hypothetical protein